jgi:hypothetical protein
MVLHSVGAELIPDALRGEQLGVEFVAEPLQPRRQSGLRGLPGLLRLRDLGCRANHGL